MRRSRIKAVASVPARRKPTPRDGKEETTDKSKATPIETGSEQKELCKPTTAENSEQTAKKQTEVSVEIPKLNTKTNNADLKLEHPAIEPQPVIEPQAVEIPDTVAKCVDTSIKRSEQKEESVDKKEIPSPQKQSTVVDSQASGANDAKTVTTNTDTAVVVKTSQTRTSFMRPTPRLDGGGRMRRNSVQGSGASASESEDDSRRGPTGISNRVRNDSVSSAHSPKGRSQNHSAGVNSSAAETIDGDVVGSANVPKNSPPSTARRKRKMVVSESARKLAEARREFLLKHEHKQPDKSKLIMYDLIYYNPVTNPMKKADGSAASSTQRISSSVIRAETEDEDDDEDDPGEAMPVPQVKVGPDGSLVIDEQSLVIEQTGAKKSRQAMARTEALVDEDANGSGFYKKRPKSKDWPKWETLKFYKALNTVGTDFLLIQSLFPKRSRQEIKLKFKKEEKMNPRLVEKALTYHQEFDIDSLKEDLATFEESVKKRTEIAKALGQPAARQRGRKRKKSKSRRMVAASISEMNDSVGEGQCSVERTDCDDEELQEATSSGEQKKSGQRRSVTNDTPSRPQSALSCNESGSDTEIYQVKPTRSGRVPKIRKLQAPTINTLDNTFSEDEEDVECSTVKDTSTSEKAQQSVSLDSNDSEKTATVGTICVQDKNPVLKSQSFQNSLSGISQVEPGSLVIVSRESTDEPGETVLQVYMVSSDIADGHGKSLKQNMTPVVLTPELLNTVTAGITKVAPIDIKPE